MVLDSLLNPVFSPLLYLPPWLSILILAFLISSLVIFIYKKFTDQEAMKGLKEQIKHSQEEIKKSKDNPSRALQIQKQAMELNMKYMMHSMKATLITFLPIILIFGWMSSHIAYEPLVAGQPFDVVVTLGLSSSVAGTTAQQVLLDAPSALTVLTSKNQTPLNNTVAYTLKPAESLEGTYALAFMVNNKTYTKDVLVVAHASKRDYLNPTTSYKEDLVKTIVVKNVEVKPLGTFSLFGWHPGWLGVYIIFSIIFSMALRKIFKVY